MSEGKSPGDEVGQEPITSAGADLFLSSFHFNDFSGAFYFNVYDMEK